MPPAKSRKAAASTATTRKSTATAVKKMARKSTDTMASGQKSRKRRHVLSNKVENERVESDDDDDDMSRKGQLSYSESVEDEEEELDAPASVRKSKKKKAARGSFTAEDILDTLSNRRTAIEEEVNAWIDLYNSDANSALLLLVNTLIRLCGASQDLTEEAFEEQEVKSLVDNIDQYFAGVSGDYPLIHSKTGKKFRSRMLDFWYKLTVKAKEEIIFDNTFMTTMMQWITVLPGSHLRCVRHTSTVIALRILDGLVSIHQELKQKFDTVRRQLEAGGVSGARKTQLEKDKDKTHERIVTVEEWLRDMFKGVFMLRFRDTVADIRVACIESLGTWMAACDYFLEDKYLKYLGWQLNDKDASVRLAALRDLTLLYDKPECRAPLESFTDRFRKRIIEMTDDADDHVAAQAFNVAKALLCYRGSDEDELTMLQEDECQALCEKVYHPVRDISLAAGDFIYHRYLREHNTPSSQGSQGKSAKAHAAEDVLKGLVEVSIDIGGEDPFALVDSLWHHIPELRNWKLMAGMLLEPHNSLTVDEETALVRVLCASIERATGPRVLAGRLDKAKLTAKEKEEKETLSADITDFCATFLPRLMERFTADEHKMELLVSVPKLMNAHSFAQHKTAADPLLKQMSRAILTYSNARLVWDCASALRHMRDNDTLAKKVDAVMTSVGEKLETTLESEWTKLREGEADDSDQVAVITGLLVRIDNLYTLLDFSRRAVLNQWAAIVIDDSSSLTVAPEITCAALRVIFKCLLWQMNNLGTEDLDARDVKALRTRVQAFMSQLGNLLEHEHENVRFMAYLVLMDVVQTFTPKLRDTSLRALAIDMDAKTAQRCQRLVMELLTDDTVIERDPDGPLENIDAGDDDDDESGIRALDRTGRLHLKRKRRALAAMLRAASFGAINPDYCAPFLAFFGDKNYTEQIKEFLKRLRQADFKLAPRVMLRFFQKEFEQRARENTLDDLTDLKESAQKLSATFGIDASATGTRGEEARKARRLLHQEAIKYSLHGNAPGDAPPHSLFLRILVNFSQRLHPLDARDILQYTNEKCARVDVRDDPAVEMFKDGLERIVNGGRVGLGRKATNKTRISDETIDSDLESDASPPAAAKTSAPAQKSKPGRKPRGSTTPVAAVTTPGGWISKPQAVRSSAKRGRGRPRVSAALTPLALRQPREDSDESPAAKRPRRQRKALSDSE